ncbi:Bin3-domain-containing protein [Trametes elegans]|nr:Bin3-domain-containing protein [Trametes elegans]
MAHKSTSVPIHGNYHGYYNKRPSAHDRRLALIPRSLFRGKRVLDVGCNEGWVTCEIGQRLGARRVVGVDIDDALVRSAWKHRRSVWSQQGPPSRAGDAVLRLENNAAPAGCRKRRRLSSSTADSNPDPDSVQALAGIPDYFPASCEHMFGPLPIPDATSTSASHGGASADAFPHNVAFRTADWVSGEIPDDAEGYDVVLAFSVSKWIHLNGGDDGLARFFRRVHGVLKPGGTFVLEPQEWETYAKTRRMDLKLRENAKGLKLRPEDFGQMLQDIGFGPAEHLGSAGEGGFRRPVHLYTKLQ